ncbi:MULTISPECIES: hypothetical protein [unclassified Bacillus (in: firmicutes)]|jgi:hypothetical protein|nr:MULTISPECIES: hypothetical protein [unclassified Bacillus (in: firmicutes)]CAI9388138.1 hypothetical protein BACSP_02224 [Bacillus sp. T2.9-1]
MSTRMCMEPDPEPTAMKEGVMNNPSFRSLNADKDSTLFGRAF